MDSDYRALLAIESSARESRRATLHFLPYVLSRPSFELHKSSEYRFWQCLLFHLPMSLKGILVY